ncbi:MAG: hypothetical protein NT023_00290, partial [Armatimonadetes bacterium]|nr:hypothetical protein [Armatimonadota bacterium]
IGNRTFIGIGVMNNLYVEAHQETVYDVEYPLYETDAPEVMEDFLHLLDSADFQYSSVYHWMITVCRFLEKYKSS